MERREYTNKIIYALDNLDDEEIVNQTIELLKDYKPNSVLFNVLKCERKLKHPELYNNLTSDLVGTYSISTFYEGIPEACNALKKAYIYRNSSYNAGKTEVLLNTFNGDYSYYDNLLSKCDDSDDFSFELYKALYISNEIVAFDLYYLSFNREELDKLGVVEFKNYFSITNTGMLKEDFQKKRMPYLLVKNGVNDKLINLIDARLKKCGCITYIYDGALDGIYTFFENNGITNQQISIIAAGYDIDTLVQMNPKFFRKLVNCELGPSNHTLCYGRYGTYTAYISDIYTENVAELISKSSNVKFSILIPARNSAATLEYTLKTCLNQTYDGKYEIVISDNSTNGNSEVYNLCKQIGDERITYIKTPRDLQLAKSFEYGYLHTSGEYVLAIGSDDGILPWALEELDKIVTEYPDEEVIQWERGFYAWPGFNRGQQNELIIPKKYDPKNHRIFYKKSMDYLAEVMVNPKSMYGLPMLYINSCFKRKYLQTLIDKTGALWDGVCQDIYMGVTTASINERVLNVEYPLSIAGMSSASVGANANKGIQSSTEMLRQTNIVQMESNVGGYCKYLYENYISYTGTDTSSLFTSILRLIQLGVIDEIYIEKVIPWQKWYEILTEEVDLLDIAYERKLQELLHSAHYLGDEFAQWYDNDVFKPKVNNLVKITQAEIDKYNNSTERTYKVGMNDWGGLILDASEYGIHNIYEASLLFAELVTDGYDSKTPHIERNN